MFNASIDPDYYDGEYSGHWLRTPDYYMMQRYYRDCEWTTNAGIACWLPEFNSDEFPF